MKEISKHKLYQKRRALIVALSKFLPAGIVPKSVRCFLDGDNLLPFANALCDVIEFLNISVREFAELCQEWDSVQTDLWMKTTPETYYREWRDEYGKANLCTNVKNQFLVKWVNLYLSRVHGRLCDYGCGSAVVGFEALLQDRATYLTCIDVPNLSTEFIRYRIEKYGLHDRASWTDASAFANQEGMFYDCVICIDVLEHLNNPSHILTNVIYPMLKKGGVLLLRAPWGGHIEHTDEAIIDFYGRAGRKFLGTRFRRTASFDALDVSGVYLKK
jgi:2-polyprenyl-3-methyl-5-hydroxy-6-metoxy-1,4-benzoquinol methylase